MSSAAVKFRNTSPPRQQTERARMKVVQGPDQGATFVVMTQRATIGRGEDNDIVLTDLKASRHHAEFLQQGAQWMIRDLGSANGLIHNNKVVRSAKLRSQDMISLGETVIEFMAAEAGTLLLMAPPRSASQMLQENKAFEEQRKRVQSLGRVGVPKSAIVAAPKTGPSENSPRQKILIALALALGASMFFSGEENRVQQRARKSDGKRVVVSLTPQVDVPKEINQAAEQFFRAGFREFRERNYLRAKANFENVLQIIPSHGLARLYIENCDKAIEEEVTFHLGQAKKNTDSGRYQVAKSHYEAIQRLLYRDKTSPAYVEAQDGLLKIDKLMKGDGS